MLISTTVKKSVQQYTNDSEAQGILLQWHKMCKNIFCSSMLPLKCTTVGPNKCSMNYNTATTKNCTRCAEIFSAAQCYRCRSGCDECTQCPITVTFKGPSSWKLFLFKITSIITNTNTSTQCSITVTFKGPSGHYSSSFASSYPCLKLNVFRMSSINNCYI